MGDRSASASLLLSQIHNCLCLYCLALYVGRTSEEAKLLPKTRYTDHFVEHVVKIAEAEWEVQKQRGMTREEFVRTILEEEGVELDKRIHKDDVQ